MRQNPRESSPTETQLRQHVTLSITSPYQGEKKGVQCLHYIERSLSFLDYLFLTEDGAQRLVLSVLCFVALLMACKPSVFMSAVACVHVCVCLQRCRVATVQSAQRGH